MLRAPMILYQESHLRDIREEGSDGKQRSSEIYTLRVTRVRNYH